jgi:hypothetical protein
MEAIPRKLSPEELVHLTAAERRQLGSEFDARKAVAEIKLRQWCVEQAVAVVKGISLPPSAPNATVNVNIDVVSVAKDIFNFVTAPLKPEVPNG